MDSQTRSMRRLVGTRGATLAAMMVVAIVYLGTAYSLRTQSAHLREVAVTTSERVADDADRLARVQGWQEEMLALAYEPKAGVGPGQGAADLARVQGWQEGLLALAYEPAGSAAADAEHRRWYTELQRRWAWHEFEARPGE
jgi:hypothetical protein